VRELWNADCVPQQAMRLTAERRSSWLETPTVSSFGSLVRRLAFIGLLLAALTILASIVLAF
jgi:hypothetical protein